MNDFFNYKEKIEKLGQSLDFLNDMNKDLFAQIKDESHKEQFAEIQGDTKRAIELMKEGNITEINNLHKKYADKNN